MLWWHFLTSSICHLYLLIPIVLLILFCWCQNLSVRMQVWRKLAGPQPGCPGRCSLFHLSTWSWRSKCHVFPADACIWICCKVLIFSLGFVMSSVASHISLSPLGVNCLKGGPRNKQWSTLLCTAGGNILSWCGEKLMQDAGWRREHVRWLNCTVSFLLQPSWPVSDVTIYWWLGHRKAIMDGCWSIDHLKNHSSFLTLPSSFYTNQKLLTKLLARNSFTMGLNNKTQTVLVQSQRVWIHVCPSCNS